MYLIESVGGSPESPYRCCMARASTRLKEAPEPSAPQKEEPAWRILPHNMEAEQGLLGALLVDNRAMEKIGDFLRGDHFFIPAHKRIFAAIEKMIERGQTASPVTLKSYFEKDDGLTGVGARRIWRTSHRALSPSSSRRITGARFTISTCDAS